MGWPGVQRLEARALAAAAALPRDVGGARLWDQSGDVVVHELRRAPSVRLLSWRGRVFAHWSGSDWREARVIAVGEGTEYE